jgi:hypothetical protein
VSAFFLAPRQMHVTFIIFFHAPPPLAAPGQGRGHRDRGSLDLRSTSYYERRVPLAASTSTYLSAMPLL